MNIVRLALGLLPFIAYPEKGLADTPFQGFRAGVHGGYALMDSKLKVNTSLDPRASDNSDVSGRGGMGSVTLDWMNLVGHSDVLMGIEASFNLITAKGKKSIQGTMILSPGDNDLSTTVQLRRSYEFAGKLGWLFKGAAVAYVKAGASMAYWTAKSISNSYPASGSASSNILGMMVGLGAEFPITDERLTWKIEYNFRIYKDFVHTLNNTAGLPIRSFSVKPSSNAILLGINYKLSAVDFVTTSPAKERKRKRPRRPRATS